MFTTRSYKFVLVTALISLSLLQGVSFSENLLSPGSFTTVSAEPDNVEQVAKGCANYSAPSASAGCNAEAGDLSEELSARGPQGTLIAQARAQTLQILRADNICAAWFQEVNPDTAEVFRSLHYDVDATGTPDIHVIRGKFGEILFLHPWGARSIEFSGKDSFIQLNSNGPFFVRKSRVVYSGPVLTAVSSDNLEPILIGPYTGATTEARITIMLHELGHIVGRLPRDDNSASGSSSQNTSEVLRHCKREIHQVAREESRVSN